MSSTCVAPRPRQPRARRCASTAGSCARSPGRRARLGSATLGACLDSTTGSPPLARPTPTNCASRSSRGSRPASPSRPYVPTLALPSPLQSVLDFGCGLGRNFPYLASLGASVTGFDLPPMIERCRTLAPAPVERLSDDWAEVRAASRFDLIFRLARPATRRDRRVPRLPARLRAHGVSRLSADAHPDGLRRQPAAAGRRGRGLRRRRAA